MYCYKCGAHCKNRATYCRKCNGPLLSTQGEGDAKHATQVTGGEELAITDGDDAYEDRQVQATEIQPTLTVEGTGADNALILENTRRAIERGVDVLVRTPVIPGFNDGIDDARHFAQLLHEIGAERVQLLPFHNLGESKYDLLGRDYRLHGLTNLHEEDLEEFRQAYVDAGIDAFF